MASIQPRTNKDCSTTYRVMFRIDARQAQESFLDPDAAARFARSVKVLGGRAARAAHLRELEDDGASVPTLAEWVETYLDPASGLLAGVTPGTRSNYGIIAKRSFLRRLGSFRIDTIDRAAVSGWLNWQAEQPSFRNPNQAISAKTIANYHEQ